MIKATPAKLKSGAWGIKTTTRVSIGSRVTVTTRGGKSWDAEVHEVLWTDGSSWLCSTSSKAAKPAQQRRPARHTRTGCSCGSVNEIMKASDCWQCKHDF